MSGLEPRTLALLGALAGMGAAPSLSVVLAETLCGAKLSTDERRYIEGPLVVHDSPWSADVPDWAYAQVREERIANVLGNGPLVGPTEIMAAMYGGMMDAPRPSDLTDLYLWASTKACAKHYRRAEADIWRTLGKDRPVLDADVLDRQGRLWNAYSELAHDVRRKVIKHQQAREPKKSREPVPKRPPMPLPQVQRTLFDLLGGATP